MRTIKDKKRHLYYSQFFRNLCIAVVWLTVLYSQIIQYKYFSISNGMLILGILIIFTYILTCMGESFTIKKLLSPEGIWILMYFFYAFPLGWITSPDTNGHITQWITCMEYFFIMVIISSLIMNSGSDTFHVLLLTVAIIMAILLLKSPVLYPKTEDRYSISEDVNPNALGMAFTAGIWALLYFQQKKKTPIFIVAVIVAFLCYSILKTGSRKALIAAGIIILLWLFFCYFPQVINGKSPWRPVILLFSALIIVVAAIEFVKIYSESDMAARMDDLGRETTTGSRASMYEFGWMLFKRQPLFGLGFKGFQFYHGLYSHATIIEVPVCTGICGSIIYFASYYISLKRCIVLFRYSKKHNFPVENDEIKMILVLWVAMLFYCTCIIHIYQFDSFIMFGVMFGQLAFIEKKIQQQPSSDFQDQGQIYEKKYRYIR